MRTDSEYYAPIKHFPDIVQRRRPRPADGRSTRRRSTRRLLPAYRRLRDFVRDEYLPQDAHERRVDGAARRRGLVRVLVQEHTTTDDDARRDPRARAQRGRAHPRRDGRGAAAGRLQGRPARRSSTYLRDRPAVLLHAAARTCCTATASSRQRIDAALPQAVLGLPEGGLRGARGRAVPRASRRRAATTSRPRPTARGPASSTSTRST